VGSFIGKTKEVDIQFTREKDVSRMYVQVIVLAYVPKGTNHTYYGEGFGITFEIEGYTLHTTSPC
jgi:hypothetical protein